MTETEICAYCLTAEHPIDVRGQRFTQEGVGVEYMICHSCCTVLRRHHFNDEPTKMKQFWNAVWVNLSLDECVEPLDDAESAATASAVSTQDAAAPVTDAAQTPLVA